MEGMSATLTAQQRLNLAYDSLNGLSVGDALGNHFLTADLPPPDSVPDLTAGPLPATPWSWTDDTEMACSIVDMLHHQGGIDPDLLARQFADRCDPRRSYGPGATRVLRQIRNGVGWDHAAQAVFGGVGSYGNGAAMRIAPLGAFFADDLDRAVEHALRSARVTHQHPEGVAGGVAVALAAAYAAATRLEGRHPDPAWLLDRVTEHPALTGTEVHQALSRARDLLGCSLPEAVRALGNGSQVTAQDTVPFAVWVAATHLTDYPSAISCCAAAGGDADTTAAIVGGIVAAHTGIGDVPGVTGIPHSWLDAREPFPAWLIPSAR